MSALFPQIDYMRHPAYGGMFEPDPQLRDSAMETLRPLIDQMREVETFRAEKFGYDYRPSDEIGRELETLGSAKVQIEESGMDRISAAAAPIVAKVQQRLAETRAAGQPIKYKTTLETLDRKADPEIWTAVEAALQNLGIMETAAAYYGAPSARLRGLGLLVNEPAQDWTDRQFKDLDVKPSPTTGFHIDSNGKCFVKGVLYLKDVSDEEGPFGMIPGSHKWEEGSESRVFRRAFDRSPFVSRSGKWRQLFVSLPKEMQVKAEFGSDMLEEWPETQAMVRQERRFTGPRGQLNLFNPEAVHRGGNVRQGCRHVLLVTTAAEWPAQ